MDTVSQTEPIQAENGNLRSNFASSFNDDRFSVSRRSDVALTPLTRPRSGITLTPAFQIHNTGHDNGNESALEVTSFDNYSLNLSTQSVRSPNPSSRPRTLHSQKLQNLSTRPTSKLSAQSVLTTDDLSVYNEAKNQSGEVSH